MGYGRRIQQNMPDTRLLCKSQQFLIQGGPYLLGTELLFYKELFHNGALLLFAHKTQGADHLPFLQSQPECPALFTVGCIYMKQIRLFFQRKTDLCLVILYIKNKSDGLFMILFRIEFYMHVPYLSFL